MMEWIDDGVDGDTITVEVKGLILNKVATFTAPPATSAGGVCNPANLLIYA